MTDKEKEAIKEFEKLIKLRKNKRGEITHDTCIVSTAQLETVLNLIQTQQAEIEKKDRQIEYMANFINDNTPYTKDAKILENERGVRNTKYTKQYFKNKVESRGQVV